MREASLETLITPAIGEKVHNIREHWQDIPFSQVLQDFEETPSVDPTENTSRALILDPQAGEIDETGTVVLALPHLNGWTPHHYIRARVMQQLVAPQKRVIVFPNNMRGQENYDVSNLDIYAKNKLAAGIMEPIAEKHLRTLENINSTSSLGSLSLSGYSLGGRTVLSMAIKASSRLDAVTHLNLDEAPSKRNRTAKQLRKDFSNPADLIYLYKSVKESQIPALSSAMRMDRMLTGIGWFVMESSKADAKLIQEGMTGSLDSDLMVIGSDRSIQKKTGYVDGSKLFDPRSLHILTAKTAGLVRYQGEGFHGHASGDNVINHALMVNDGLNSAE